MNRCGLEKVDTGAFTKGRLDNIEVAIKILDPSSKQGLDEFKNELSILGKVHHTNLVQLEGACFELLSLVYEFLPKGSLEDCLKKQPEVLTWQMRVRIVSEICSGLIFLHSQPRPMVHGDLKPANVLLDLDFTAKLADFGTCRLLPEVSADATAAFHVTDNVKGTLWYIHPGYLESGKITPECDVYALGITILRILTGQPPINLYRMVRKAKKNKKTMEIVDSSAGEWPAEVVNYLVTKGLACCKDVKRTLTFLQDMSSDLKDMLAKECA